MNLLVLWLLFMENTWYWFWFWKGSLWSDCCMSLIEKVVDVSKHNTWTLINLLWLLSCMFLVAFLLILESSNPLDSYSLRRTWIHALFVLSSFLCISVSVHYFCSCVYLCNYFLFFSPYWNCGHDFRRRFLFLLCLISVSFRFVQQCTEFRVELTPDRSLVRRTFQQ